MSKCAITILSLCLILNSAASLSSVDAAFPAIMENVAGAESTVIGFLTAAALPYRIMETIVHRGIVITDQVRNTANGSNQEKKRTVPADHSINPSAPDIPTAMKGNSGQAAVLSGERGHRSLRSLYGNIHPPGGLPGFIIIFLLAYLVIVYRGSLPPAGVVLAAIGTRSSVGGRVFCFLSAKRIIALLTLGCFLFSSVFAQGVQAAVEARRDADAFNALLDEYFLPPAAGRVTAGKWFGSGAVVVNIQDLHCHAEVQRNISALLASLDGKYGLENVFVEGAAGDVDTSWLAGIRDRRLRETIAETLVDQGRLTGAEHYSSLAGRPHLLKGIEDRALHRDNLVRLGKILEQKEYYEKGLRELAGELAFLQAKYFAAENRVLNETVEKRERGEVETAKYYAVLDKYAARIGRNPGRYNALPGTYSDAFPNLAAYRGMLREGRRLHYPRVARELQRFVQELKSRLPFHAYNTLLRKTDGFARLDQLYLYLAAIAKEYRVDLPGRFPHLSRFFDYTEKSRRINPAALVREERRLVEHVRIGLSRDIAELEISFLSDFFPHFRDYLLNRLAADDYEYFAKRFGTFRQLWAKYAPSDTVSRFAGDFPLLDEYYRVNCERNARFINNLLPFFSSTLGGQGDEAAGRGLSAEEFLRSLGRADRIVVVVAGGFHTKGMEELLAERKVSYLTVTPNVTRATEPAHRIYTELAREQAKLLSNALALNLASQLSSEALFELAMTAANRGLSGTGFTERNVRDLVAKVAEATGVKSPPVRFTSTEATVTFEDGRRITLVRGNAGDIVAADVSRASLPLSPAAVRVSLEEVIAAVAATGHLTFDALSPFHALLDTYPALRNMLLFAARHNLVFGDGLIVELELGPARERIDGIERNLVGRFPEFAQRIVAERERRNIDLANAAGRSAWLRAMLAVDLLGDILRAAPGSVRGDAGDDAGADRAGGGSLQRKTAAGMAKQSVRLVNGMVAGSVFLLSLLVVDRINAFRRFHEHLGTSPFFLIFLPAKIIALITMYQATAAKDTLAALKKLRTLSYGYWILSAALLVIYETTGIPGIDFGVPDPRDIPWPMFSLLVSAGIDMMAMRAAENMARGKEDDMPAAETAAASPRKRWMIAPVTEYLDFVNIIVCLVSPGSYREGNASRLRALDDFVDAHGKDQSRVQRILRRAGAGFVISSGFFAGAFVSGMIFFPLLPGIMSIGNHAVMDAAVRALSGLSALVAGGMVAEVSGIVVAHFLWNLFWKIAVQPSLEAVNRVALLVTGREAVDVAGVSGLLGRSSRSPANDVSGDPDGRIGAFDQSVENNVRKTVESIGRADIVIGIPCYDEADNIPSLVAHIQEALAAYAGRAAAIVVIGERAKEGTVQAALSLDGNRNVRVAGFTKDPDYAGREGKKWSERAFFRIAKGLGAEVFVSLDADLRIDPPWVRKLIDPVAQGTVDFVTPNYLRRYERDDKLFTHHLVSPLFSSLYGYAMHEPVGGEFAVRVKNSPLLDTFLDSPGIWTAPNPFEAFFLAATITASQRIGEVWLGSKDHKPMSKGDLPSLFSGLYARSSFEQVLRDWDYVVSRLNVRRMERIGDPARAVATAAGDILNIDPGELAEGYRVGFAKYRELYQREFPYLYGFLKALSTADPAAYDVTPSLWAAVVLVFLKRYRAADAEGKAVLLDALAPLFLARVATFVGQLHGATYDAMEKEIERQTETFASLKPFLASPESDEHFIGRILDEGAPSSPQALGFSPAQLRRMVEELTQASGIKSTAELSGAVAALLLEGLPRTNGERVYEIGGFAEEMSALKRRLLMVVRNGFESELSTIRKIRPFSALAMETFDSAMLPVKSRSGRNIVGYRFAGIEFREGKLFFEVTRDFWRLGKEQQIAVLRHEINEFLARHGENTDFNGYLRTERGKTSVNGVRKEFFETYHDFLRTNPGGNYGPDLAALIDAENAARELVRRAPIPVEDVIDIVRVSLPGIAQALFPYTGSTFTVATLIGMLADAAPEDTPEEGVSVTESVQAIFNGSGDMRVRNLLMRHGIMMIRGLISHSEEDLLEYPGLGATMLGEIRERLEKNGFFLAEHEPFSPGEMNESDIVGVRGTRRGINDSDLIDVLGFGPYIRFALERRNIRTVGALRSRTAEELLRGVDPDKAYGAPDLSWQHINKIRSRLAAFGLSLAPGRGSALSHASSYALGRWLLGLFGGKSADAAALRTIDRITERILVPFIFLWDLPLHTLAMLIGKGGFTMERVEMLRIGPLRLHMPQLLAAWAGVGVTVAATLLVWYLFPRVSAELLTWLPVYLAYSGAHALYNFRHGAGTLANAPLAVGNEDRVRAMLAQVGDIAERRRLERVLGDDRGMALFVEDTTGRADRLDVLDYVGMSRSERKELVGKLRQWFAYRGTDVVLSAALRHIISLLQAEETLALENTLLFGVSRDSENRIRDIEVVAGYGNAAAGLEVFMLEAAPWNRGTLRRYRGVGSQMLYSLFAGVPAERVTISVPLPDMQALLGKYATGVPFLFGEEGRLSKTVRDKFVADQRERVLLAKREELRRVAAGEYSPEPEKGKLSRLRDDLLAGARRAIDGAADDTAMDSAVRDFESRVRALLSGGRVSEESLQDIYGEISDALTAKGYVLRLSPSGFDDERALVLYKKTAKGNIVLEGETIEVWYVDQVTRFKDGRLRGTLGWSSPFDDFIVAFPALMQWEDRHRILPALDGGPAFRKPGNDARARVLADYYGEFLRKGLGAVAGDTAGRIRIRERNVLLHEAEHELNRRRLGGMRTGDIVHPRIEEELAALRTIMEGEPFVVFAGLLSGAANNSTFAWRLLGRFAGVPLPSEEEAIVGKLDTLMNTPAEQLRRRAGEIYAEVRKEWESAYRDFTGKGTMRPAARADGVGLRELMTMWSKRTIPLREWSFGPGMRFEDKNEWWGDMRPRKDARGGVVAHGGVDFYAYTNLKGNAATVAAGMRFSPIYDGVVVGIVDDIRGKTVIMRHEIYDGQGTGARRMFTFYAHCEPAEDVRIGKRFTRQDTVARIARPKRAGAPPHLHLSVALSADPSAFDGFRWEASRPEMFIDPLGNGDLFIVNAARAVPVTPPPDAGSVASSLPDIPFMALGGKKIRDKNGQEYLLRVSLSPNRHAIAIAIDAPEGVNIGKQDWELAFEYGPYVHPAITDRTVGLFVFGPSFVRTSGILDSRAISIEDLKQGLGELDIHVVEIVEQFQRRGIYEALFKEWANVCPVGTITTSTIAHFDTLHTLSTEGVDGFDSTVFGRAHRGTGFELVKTEDQRSLYRLVLKKTREPSAPGKGVLFPHAWRQWVKATVPGGKGLVAAYENFVAPFGEEVIFTGLAAGAGMFFGGFLGGFAALLASRIAFVLLHNSVGPPGLTLREKFTVPAVISVLSAASYLVAPVVADAIVSNIPFVSAVASQADPALVTATLLAAIGHSVSNIGTRFYNRLPRRTAKTWPGQGIITLDMAGKLSFGKYLRTISLNSIVQHLDGQIEKYADAAVRGEEKVQPLRSFVALRNAGDGVVHLGIMNRISFFRLFPGVGFQLIFPLLKQALANAGGYEKRYAEPNANVAYNLMKYREHIIAVAAGFPLPAGGKSAHEETARHADSIPGLVSRLRDFRRELSREDRLAIIDFTDPEISVNSLGPVSRDGNEDDVAVIEAAAGIMRRALEHREIVLNRGDWVDAMIAVVQGLSHGRRYAELEAGAWMEDWNTGEKLSADETISVMTWYLEKEFRDDPATGIDTIDFFWWKKRGLSPSDAVHADIIYEELVELARIRYFTFKALSDLAGEKYTELRERSRIYREQRMIGVDIYASEALAGAMERFRDALRELGEMEKPPVSPFDEINEYSLFDRDGWWGWKGIASTDRQAMAIAGYYHSMQAKLKNDFYRRVRIPDLLTVLREEIHPRIIARQRVARELNSARYLQDTAAMNEFVRNGHVPGFWRYRAQMTDNDAKIASEEFSGAKEHIAKALSEENEESGGDFRPDDAQWLELLSAYFERFFELPHYPFIKLRVSAMAMFDELDKEIAALESKIDQAIGEVKRIHQEAFSEELFPFLSAEKQWELAPEPKVTVQAMREKRARLEADMAEYQDAIAMLVSGNAVRLSSLFIGLLGAFRSFQKVLEIAGKVFDDMQQLPPSHGVHVISRLNARQFNLDKLWEGLKVMPEIGGYARRELSENQPGIPENERRAVDESLAKMIAHVEEFAEMLSPLFEDDDTGYALTEGFVYDLVQRAANIVAMTGLTKGWEKETDPETGRPAHPFWVRVAEWLVAPASLVDGLLHPLKILAGWRAAGTISREDALRLKGAAAVWGLTLAAGAAAAVTGNHWAWVLGAGYAANALTHALYNVLFGTGGVFKANAPLAYRSTHRGTPPAFSVFKILVAAVFAAAYGLFFYPESSPLYIPGGSYLLTLGVPALTFFGLAAIVDHWRLDRTSRQLAVRPLLLHSVVFASFAWMFLGTLSGILLDIQFPTEGHVEDFLGPLGLSGVIASGIQGLMQKLGGGMRYVNDAYAAYRASQRNRHRGVSLSGAVSRMMTILIGMFGTGDDSPGRAAPPQARPDEEYAKTGAVSGRSYFTLVLAAIAGVLMFSLSFEFAQYLRWDTANNSVGTFDVLDLIAYGAGTLIVALIALDSKRKMQSEGFIVTVNYVRGMRQYIDRLSNERKRAAAYRETATAIEAALEKTDAPFRESYGNLLYAILDGRSEADIQALQTRMTLRIWRHRPPDFPAFLRGIFGLRPRAILPKNEAEAVRLAGEGRSPAGITARIALAEFFDSLNAYAFVRAHDKKGGAAAVVAATALGGAWGAGMAAPAVAGIALAFGVAVSALAVAAAGFLIGLVAGNLVTHAVIDYHFIRSTEFAEAVRKFGPVTMDGGMVFPNIFIPGDIEELPQGRTDLRNTGMKVAVNGEYRTVWASTKEGALSLYIAGTAGLDEAGRWEVVLQINRMLSGGGHMKGSGKLSRKFVALFNRLPGVRLRNVDFTARAIMIDYRLKDKNTIVYNNDATMVVSPYLFESAEKSLIIQTLGALVTVRNAEAVAMPFNIFLHLDSFETEEDFLKSLEVFTAAGNGRIIVDPSRLALMLEKAEERVTHDRELIAARVREKIRRIAELARQGGVQMYVITENSGQEDAYRSMGFAGYVTGMARGVPEIYDFVTGGTINARLITGFNGVDELRDQLQRSPEAKIVTVSGLRVLLEGGERSILGRVALAEMLKVAVLGLSGGRAMTEGHVRDVAYAWDREQLPEMPESGDERKAFIGALTAALRREDPGKITAAMTAGKRHAVEVYLARIEGAEADPGKRRRLQAEFLKGIAGKMLAKSKLDTLGRTSGLADSRLERILGEKLLVQLLEGTEGRGVAFTPDDFAREQGMSADEFFRKLYATVMEMKDSTAPEAVNALIELIAQLGERKVLLQDERQRAPFNAQSVGAVLKAA